MIEDIVRVAVESVVEMHTFRRARPPHHVYVNGALVGRYSVQGAAYNRRARERERMRATMNRAIAEKLAREATVNAPKVSP